MPLDKILHCHAVSEADDIPASQTPQELKRILHSHEEVFNDSTLERLKGFKAKVQPVKEEPKLYRASPIAYA